MKILHISNSRRLTHGQRLQLKAEFDGANNLQLENLTWDILAFHTEPPIYSFERRIPRFFRGVFLRKLYSWVSILRVYKQYDIVIERRVTFDPFIFIFGWFIPNRYTVHHSKEIEELKIIKKGLKGILASALERFSGLVNARQVLGFIGVTKELAEYENKVNKTSLPQLFFPNGVDIEEITLIEDEREDELNAVFMSGSFNPWHGLDLLLNAILGNVELIYDSGLKIHLIGKLNEEQLSEINKIDPNNDFIKVYGHLSSDEYKTILTRCDFGIGSLAMYRQNLNEGTTLKVREYLASGIPVYSGHKDSALPDDFLFYFCDAYLNMKNMIVFGDKMKGFSRIEVRNSASPYIKKVDIMIQLIDNFKISLSKTTQY